MQFEEIVDQVRQLGPEERARVLRLAEAAVEILTAALAEVALEYPETA